MTADEKIAHQRLSVLELAQALGNVSEACRQRDISRSQFYEYKRRFPWPSARTGRHMDWKVSRTCHPSITAIPGQQRLKWYNAFLR